MMLAMSFTPFKIKEALKERYPLAKIPFKKIISAARKRNLEALHRAPEECKSDSLVYWTRKLQDAESRKQRAVKELEQARNMLDQLSTTIKSLPVGSEEWEKLQRMMDKVYDLRHQAYRVIDRCEHESKGVQDRLDRMLGTYEPMRIEVKHTGEATRKPITLAEMKAQLLVMLQEAGTMMGVDPNILPTLNNLEHKTTLVIPMKGDEEE